MNYTDKEIQIIIKYYPDHGSAGAKGCQNRLKKIGRIRKRKAISLKAFNLGIKYTGEKKGVYKKGRIPANKGKKMSPEMYAKCSRTMFKKGRQPHNTLYDGAISYRKDNTGRSYWYVRTEINKWDLLHRIIYENTSGVTLGPDECIRFKDGDTNNIHPDNLDLISNKENMNLNNPRMYYPADVVDAIRLNNKLKRQINAKK